MLQVASQAQVRLNIPFLFGGRPDHADFHPVSPTQRPSDPSSMGTLLQPVSQSMASLGALAEGRRTPGFNHIKAMAESVQSLSWLAYTGPSCGERKHSGRVYAREGGRRQAGGEPGQMSYLKLHQAMKQPYGDLCLSSP